MSEDPYEPTDLALAEAEAAELRRLLDDARQRCEFAEVMAAWIGGQLTEEQSVVLTGLGRFDLIIQWEELVSRVLRRWREHRDSPEEKPT